MFNWLRLFSREFSKRWCTWGWPTRIGMVVGFISIVALFIGIGIGITQYFLASEQFAIQRELLDMEKQKEPVIIPSMNFAYPQTGEQILSMCKEDKERCAILEDIQGDKTYYDFSFTVLNVGAPADNVSIEVRPNGRARIVLVHSTGVRPLTIEPMYIQYNTTKGPTIKLAEFGNSDAIVAQIFIEDIYQKDIEWEIIIETDEPRFYSVWRGPATTTITAKGSVESKIVRIH